MGLNLSFSGFPSCVPKSGKESCLQLLLVAWGSCAWFVTCIFFIFHRCIVSFTFVSIACRNGIELSFSGIEQKLLLIPFTDLMEEELFAQFNKIANSIMHLKTKEQNGNGEPDPHNKDMTKISEVRSERHVKCGEPVGVSGENFNPAMKIKALQV